MTLTSNQELVLAQMKFTVAKMDRNNLETRFLALVKDYFEYQNAVKNLTKEEAFNFLGQLNK